MALVSQSIKNLKGGISQQPDVLRYDDQGALQVNGFSSEVEGLQKRPPSVHVARIANQGGLGSKPLCHVINRDEQEQYACFFGEGGALNIFDLKTGSGIPVSFTGNAQSYLVSDKPRDDLRLVTVADYTFVINRQRTVQWGSTAKEANDVEGRQCLVSCWGGQYGRTYSIYINGSLMAQHKTPLGDEVAHAEQIDIKYILTKLKEDFYAKLGGSSMGWSCTIGAGYLWFSSPAGRNISSLEVEDGYNGKLLTGFRHTVTKTSDLPVNAPDGYQVKIQGETSSGQDAFWVEFHNDDKVWREIVAPSARMDFNGDTMPHIMVRRADGVFEVKAADWTHRASGDDDTNPYPSFLDGKINDVFFFRNRLGFLCEENVILSEAGAYFNFFPPSVAVTADSDPIDVAVSTNRISILKCAVPFAEELLLWSDQAQFVMSADGILTPTSVQLNLTTEFEVSQYSRPLGIGRGVYFVSPRAKYSAIRRYYAVQDVTQVKNAEDISAHVPSYVPNGIFKMSGSSTENFLSVLTEGDERTMYLYKFLYLEDKLVQQSWSHWDFGRGVRLLCAEMIGAVMHIVLDTPSGVFLERIEFTQNTLDFPAHEPYRLYMDRKKIYTVPANAFDNDRYTTRIRLSDVYGGQPLWGDYWVVTTAGVLFSFPEPVGGWPAGADILEFDGDLSNATVLVGERYDFIYKFSKFLIKQTAADGSVATEDIGRLQLRRAWVNYNNSGNFQIDVINQGRTFTYNMTARRLGTVGMILGEEDIDTGQFKFPVSANAKIVDVVMSSGTPNPLAIIGAGWEGNYIRRSSGI